MKKRPEVYLAHMLGAIERIERYTKAMKRASFFDDLKTQDAVIRQLEILGEAAGQVAETHVQESPIPWRAIVGMRHRLIHDYLGVDLEIVWQTVKHELPKLKRYVKGKLG